MHKACICFALCMTGCMTAAAAEDSKATLPEDTWSAGADTLSVAMPGALSSSDATHTRTQHRSKRGEFLAVPIPRVDPALGTGLVGAAAYIFRLNPQDTATPPSILGAAAMWMDKGSWGGGVGGKFYFREDQWRLLAGAVYADLRYDLVTSSAATGELSWPLSQEAYGGIAHAQYRVAQNMYVGVRTQIGKLTTSLRADDEDFPVAVPDDIGITMQVNSLGPTFAFDTRDSAYYPRSGIALDAGVDIYFGALGSDISFQQYAFNYRQYLKVRDTDVFAWQGYVCAAGNSPPFFLQCQVGPMSILRGYSFGEHRGDAMAAVQAEYRWQFRPRWIAAAFAGAAQVADDFGDFALDENLYSAGVGLRFVVEPKNGVTLRVDYAVGEDEDAVYVSVGEAF